VNHGDGFHHQKATPSSTSRSEVDI